jgi:hypothetical protein
MSSPDNPIKKLKQIPYDTAKAILDKEAQHLNDVRNRWIEEDAAIVNKEMEVLRERLAKEFEERKLKFLARPSRLTRFFYFYVKRPQSFDREARRIPSRPLLDKLCNEMQEQFGLTLMHWDPAISQHKFKIYVTARSDAELAEDLAIKKDLEWKIDASLPEDKKVDK